jgi:hypothetical protein
MATPELKPDEIAPGITYKRYYAARNVLLCFGGGLLTILLLVIIQRS